jgi:hypothetical protein
MATVRYTSTSLANMMRDRSLITTTTFLNVPRSTAMKIESLWKADRAWLTFNLFCLIPMDKKTETQLIWTAEMQAEFDVIFG